mmetsp:Transcript_4092/g.15810  ORF Transcript_4092/g.15810 Transcript_4092/m.15810 type:complete len:311 (+) Transcript_4092:323-1255(+)
MQVRRALQHPTPEVAGDPGRAAEEHHHPGPQWLRQDRLLCAGHASPSGCHAARDAVLVCGADPRDCQSDLGAVHGAHVAAHSRAAGHRPRSRDEGRPNHAAYRDWHAGDGGQPAEAPPARYEPLEGLRAGRGGQDDGRQEWPSQGLAADHEETAEHGPSPALLRDLHAGGDRLLQKDHHEHQRRCLCGAPSRGNQNPTQRQADQGQHRESVFGEPAHRVPEGHLPRPHGPTEHHLRPDQADLPRSRGRNAEGRFQRQLPERRSRVPSARRRCAKLPCGRVQGPRNDQRPGARCGLRGRLNGGELRPANPV